MNMLKSRLKDFKLSGIYNTLDDRLALVKDKSLSYQEFLELLLEDEENNRRENINHYTMWYAFLGIYP